jgi:hemoglobin
MRHAPFAIDPVARDRWVAMMERALEESDLPTGASTILREFLLTTATFLINRGPQI